MERGRKRVPPATEEELGVCEGRGRGERGEGRESDQ